LAAWSLSGGAAPSSGDDTGAAPRPAIEAGNGPCGEQKRQFFISNPGLRGAWAEQWVSQPQSLCLRGWQDFRRLPCFGKEIAQQLPNCGRYSVAFGPYTPPCHIKLSNKHEG
jgi:hypothetical protein